MNETYEISIALTHKIAKRTVQKTAACYCATSLSAGRLLAQTRSQEGLVDHTAVAHTVASLKTHSHHSLNTVLAVFNLSLLNILIFFLCLSLTVFLSPSEPRSQLSLAILR